MKKPRQSFQGLKVAEARVSKRCRKYGMSSARFYYVAHQVWRHGGVAHAASEECVPEEDQPLNHTAMLAY